MIGKYAFDCVQYENSKNSLYTKSKQNVITFFAEVSTYNSAQSNTQDSTLRHLNRGQNCHVFWVKLFSFKYLT